MTMGRAWGNSRESETWCYLYLKREGETVVVISFVSVKDCELKITAQTNTGVY